MRNFRGYTEIIFISAWNIISVCFLTVIESKLTAPQMPAFFFFIAILTAEIMTCVHHSSECCQMALQE